MRIQSIQIWRLIWCWLEKLVVWSWYAAVGASAFAVDAARTHHVFALYTNGKEFYFWRWRQ